MQIPYDPESLLLGVYKGTCICIPGYTHKNIYDTLFIDTNIICKTGEKPKSSGQ